MSAVIGERRPAVLKLIKIITKLAFYPSFRIQTTGLESIPKKGAFIILPKHQRWEDIPLLGLTIQRPLYYIAKHELFRNPVYKWFISSLGGIPLNRDRPLESRQSLKSMIDLLKGGEGVVIFLEGTYYREGMGVGHVGLIRMIFPRFTIPFIPVGIRYSRKRGRTLVKIEIGRPIYGDSSMTVKEVVDRVMNEIARLSGIR
ncbi:lysophospholipid acyltransferase family protein [Thermodesulfobacteriota bacterium]